MLKLEDRVIVTIQSWSLNQSASSDQFIGMLLLSNLSSGFGPVTISIGRSCGLEFWTGVFHAAPTPAGSGCGG